jgi:molybdate-binding protein
MRGVTGSEEGQAIPPCQRCGSSQVIKNGHIHNGKAKVACKDCRRQFVENPQQQLTSEVTKALIDKLLLEGLSLAGIVHSTGVSGRWLQLVTFAHREQGLIVAKGNPKHIQSLADLPRLRYVNRQRGAGTRILLDYEMKRLGISPTDVAGYGHEEYTCLAVAAAVATGIADGGLGVRGAAIALDLDFIPVGWERYDLVIPGKHLEHVQHLLDVLRSDIWRQALSAQPGYDTRETGKIQLQ